VIGRKKLKRAQIESSIEA